MVPPRYTITTPSSHPPPRLVSSMLTFQLRRPPYRPGLALNLAPLSLFHLAVTSLPSSRSFSTFTDKFMAASYQGASGPSGYVGLLPPPGQPAGRNHATPGPALTRFEQPSQERLAFNQIRKLTVRLVLDMLDLMIDEPSGDTRTRSWNMTRCDPILPTKYLLNPPVGVVCDKGNDCCLVGAPR